MTKKKLITISAAALVCIAVAGFGIYSITAKDQPMPIEPQASSVPENSSAVEVSSASEDDYVVPPIEPIGPVSKDVDTSSADIAVPTATSKPEENKVTATPNNNGGKDYNVSRPEYSQPPEDETIYDEPEDEGATDNNGDNANTSGGNTPGGGSGGQQGGDKPQGGGSNDGTNTPGGSGGNGDKPQGGGNQGGGKPGQIYVPGFGWQTPTGGYSETVSNAGTGDVIGE